MAYDHLEIEARWGTILGEDTHSPAVFLWLE